MYIIWCCWFSGHVIFSMTCEHDKTKCRVLLDAKMSKHKKWKGVNRGNLDSEFLCMLVRPHPIHVLAFIFTGECIRGGRHLLVTDSTSIVCACVCIMEAYLSHFRIFACIRAVTTDELERSEDLAWDSNIRVFLINSQIWRVPKSCLHYFSIIVFSDFLPH